MKVVNDLSQKGYLDTVRGRNVGIRLMRKPRDINIGQVVHRTWTRTMPDLHLSKEEAPRAIAHLEYFRGFGTFSHVAT